MQLCQLCPTSHHSCNEQCSLACVQDRKHECTTKSPSKTVIFFCPISERHWPWWLWELHGRLRQAAVRQARPPWDSGDWHSTHAQGACECPRPDQTSLHSGVALLLQSLDLSMSAWWHHLDERNPVGQQSPGQVAYHQHSKYQPLWRECPHWNQRQQRHHYFGETQWTPHLQKPVCRQLLHWEVECRIVQGYCFRTPQHNHHFGEALYASCQQKPVCSIFPAPAVECRLVQTNYSHKQWPNHRFGEGLYDPRLQRPGCMTFRHPAVECRIVHPHYYRMRQHCHHCGEAPYGSCLQKPGCRTCLHPKVEFGIVPLHHPRKPQHFHHFGEALYVRSQQTPVCMTLLNLKVELHIARPGCLRKPQHGHHFGEALCDSRLQKPGCRTFPHLSAEYHIVHAHYLRKPQHCHHSGEAPCGCSLQKPLPPGKVCENKQYYISWAKAFELFKIYVLLSTKTCKDIQTFQDLSHSDPFQLASRSPLGPAASSFFWS